MERGKWLPDCGTSRTDPGVDGDSGSREELMLIVRDETVGITYGLCIEKEEKIREYS